MKTIKAKVHWVPTNKPEEWWKHHYITTDEEIKEGDWFYDDLDIPENMRIKQLKKAIDYSLIREDMRQSEKDRWSHAKKIIATTDPKLNEVNDKNKVDESWFRPFIPQIPQSFIEECYASGGIDEVLVEYDTEYCTCLEWKETYECPNHYIDNHTQKVMCSKEPTKQPKLNPDNTIIIHPVEEKMYSREEVEELCRDAFSLGQQWVHEITFTDKDPMTVNKWIEENL